MTLYQGAFLPSEETITINMAQLLLERLIPEQDWDNPSVAKTPARFCNMLRELTTPEPFNLTVFDNPIKAEGQSEMVVIKDITFKSLCEHHVVPFVGVAHIAYIPDDRLAGLSKFARAVRYFAAGLWTQEALTNHIASYLDDELEPLGLAIIMEAEHMCMTLRGVQAPGARTVTTQLRGLFLDPDPGRDPKGEFLEHIKR